MVSHSLDRVFEDACQLLNFVTSVDVVSVYFILIFWFEDDCVTHMRIVTLDFPHFIQQECGNVNQFSLLPDVRTHDSFYNHGSGEIYEFITVLKKTCTSHVRIRFKCFIEALFFR